MWARAAARARPTAPHPLHPRLLATTAPRQTHPTPPLDPNPAHPQPAPAPAPPSAPHPATAAPSPSTTHFGFRDVPNDLKESLVRGVFSSVASSYDVMNDAMSLGIHRLWKDHYVSKLDPHGALRCLDVAGGTGDIALRILDHARTRYGDRDTSVHMVDINPEMLEEGKKRFAQTMYHATPQIAFDVGNAETLSQFADNTFDVYTISFGIRNVTDIPAALRTAHRVLKPGGVLSILEFSHVDNPVLAKAYDLFSFNVIPELGHLLAADRDSYQYLVESIRRFPPAEKFAQMIRDAGFEVAEEEPFERLTWGIAAIHNGVKL
ncbi:hypothetical protein Rhopal_003580-T1 [Rhodotorula paludigena]|uniref:2-methoxy-6-polyprenyl-1,4-benzoquinol methylase, mitochondrial n=1 Tax=Rhodotorula paludigena TaxID=86838 RepID=A0AAV5GK30_9BASI|nr:hypothetical protein Rhopal_003580-T1 [Rhodotorula paludigena]